MSTGTMTTSKKTNISLDWPRLKSILVKAAWLSIVSISICYSLVGSWDDLFHKNFSEFEKWIYVYLNFGSFVFGVIAASLIFWRKSNDLAAIMASLMLVTFTSTDDGFRFWYWLATGQFSAIDVFVPLAYAISLFFSILYLALLTTTLVFVLLTFPVGKFIFKWTRWLFIVMIVGEIILICIMGIVEVVDFFRKMEGGLSYGVYYFLNFIKSIILIPLAIWQIYHLRKTTNPIQRQQIKWIMTSLIGMTLFYAIGNLVSNIFNLSTIPVWSFLPLLLFTYGFIFTFFVAIWRYRLWDIDLIINKTLVYSSLTAILGSLGFASGALFEYIARIYDQNSSIAVIGVLVFLLAIFKPMRDGLQALVDRHFKPEEVDFSGTMVEFTPAVLSMLSSREILEILVKQSIEQLNLASATIFLKRADARLEQAGPLLQNSELHTLALEAKMREQLENGKVAMAPEISPFSLFIPLVVRRAYKPDFLGVLALGPRNNGIGYSTSVLKSLQDLGAEAGKVIYVAKFREQVGKETFDWFAAVEQEIAFSTKNQRV